MDRPEGTMKSAYQAQDKEAFGISEAHEASMTIRYAQRTLVSYSG